MCWRDLSEYSERMLKASLPSNQKKKKSLVFCSQKVPGGFQPRQPSLERISQWVGSRKVKNKCPNAEHYYTVNIKIHIFLSTKLTSLFIPSFAQYH
jgi:hypothetical protein